MLKRIRIKNYKSLKDVEVELTPLCVLFGPNAAGKSNFLDAMQLLSRIVCAPSIKSAFDPPYRGKPLESITATSGGIEELLKMGSVSFSIEVDVELSQHVIDKVSKQIADMREAPHDGKKTKSTGTGYIKERLLRYCVEIEILPETGIFRVKDESLLPLTKDGQISKSRSPFLSKHQENHKLHLRMEGQAHPRYFDLMLDHSILSLPHYTPYYPHLVAFREEISQYAFFYFEPRERMRDLCPIKEVRRIGAMGEDLPSFLNTLKITNPAQFRGIENALKAIIPSITGIVVKPNPFGEVDLWVREGDRLMSARVLSEGTLRILGLLSIFGTKTPPNLVGFEEPENGIPPKQISLIAEILQSKAKKQYPQIIVTTHSPLLPDYIKEEYLYPCKKVNGETEISRINTIPLLKKQEISDALEDTPLSVSQRMVRGDFDV